MVLDSALNPIYANDEAIRILTYPKNPKRIRGLNSFLVNRIQSVLNCKAPARSALAGDLTSGNRHYQYRTIPIEPEAQDSARHLSLALLIERSASVGYSASELAERFHLTKRERESVQYLFQGFTSKEIATRMNISPNTVKAFMRLIMVKMGATTRSGIIGRIFTEER